MSIVEYYMKDGFRKFNPNQAIKKAWGIDCDGFDYSPLEGLKLQDRQNPTDTTTIDRLDWMLTVAIIYFKEGGYLALDHTIEQFELYKEVPLTIFEIDVDGEKMYIADTHISKALFTFFQSSEHSPDDPSCWDLQIKPMTEEQMNLYTINEVDGTQVQTFAEWLECNFKPDFVATTVW